MWIERQVEQHHVARKLEVAPFTANLGADQHLGIFIFIDLVNGLTRFCAPIAPLHAINWPELTVIVGPVIPDRNAVLFEIANVRIAAQKPQELMHDRLNVQLLGCNQWKSLAEIEAHLVTENTKRSCPGSIILACTVITYIAHH